MGIKIGAAAEKVEQIRGGRADPPHILLIDINALGYAAMHTPLGSMEFQGFPTGGIHGAMNSVVARMKECPGAVPFVLWDSSAKWRSELLPEYKSTRHADAEKARVRDMYRMQTPILRLLFTDMGIPQITCGGAEADDLAGVICRHLDPSWLVELVTGDTDWWQALAANVSWFSRVHKMLVTQEFLADPANGLKDGHFVSAQEYLQSKALAGDKSDEIPGIEGVGLKTGAKLVREHGGDIRNLWAGVQAGTVKPKGVIAERVATEESRAIFERNIRLMDWSQAPEIDTALLAVSASASPNWGAVEATAQDFGLKTVLTRAREAMAPWKGGWGDALDAVDRALKYRMSQPLVREAQAA